MSIFQPPTKCYRHSETSNPSPSVQVLAHLINWTQLRAVCNYSTQCFCTSCRVTTGAHQLICPSAGRSVVAVFLYQWSTLPTWWTLEKRPPVSWPFIHHTQNTVGPWMMSLSLPIQRAWQVS